MGTLSLSKAGRLFWLGRYTERVYAQLKETKKLYDAYVDGNEADYADFCTRVGIPNNYTSTANFCRKFMADRTNPCSLVSVLGYAYDNAIVLRETIGTETLSYVQLACNCMDKAIMGDTPEFDLQLVIDYIMAFRGCAEYSMNDETSRTMLRTGANLEKLDLMLRLDYPVEACRVECERLLNRLYKLPVHPAQDKLNALVDHALDQNKPDLSKWEMLACIEGLLPEI